MGGGTNVTLKELSFTRLVLNFYRKVTIVINEPNYAEITYDVLQILAAWRVNSTQQAVLLGLAPNSLYQYKTDASLQQNQNILDRAKILLAIDQSICLVFPHAPELARLWITTPSHLFSGRTPLEIMLSEGLSGITHIQSVLDGTEVW
jgi:hypothetical protein